MSFAVIVAVILILVIFALYILNSMSTPVKTGTPQPIDWNSYPYAHMITDESKKYAESQFKLVDESPFPYQLVDRYAKSMPNNIAIIDSDSHKEYTWKQLSTLSKAFAAHLMSSGLKAGDTIAFSLVLLPEFIIIMVAAGRVGCRIAPLDPRFTATEVDAAFRVLNPKAYLFLGKTPAKDFLPMVKKVKALHPSIPLWVQFQGDVDGRSASEFILPGCVLITDWIKSIKTNFVKALVLNRLRRAARNRDPQEGWAVVFSSGSTGEPKGCLLPMAGTMEQAAAISSLCLNPPDPAVPERTLVCLPQSHVGCLTEQLMCSLVRGSTIVSMKMFTAKSSYKAIKELGITQIGMIPTMLRMIWNLPEYVQPAPDDRIEVAVYGGSSVSVQFLEKLARMGKHISTGLGATETNGFSTHVPRGSLLLQGRQGYVGIPSPRYPLTIRDPMAEGGAAGEEVPAGEIGEICFRGRQTFIEYLDEPEKTALTISSEGWVYTGDLGKVEEDGLVLCGRSKFVVRQKGFQSFPPAIENKLLTILSGRASQICVIGVPHRIFGESIVLYVIRNDPSLTEEQVRDAARQLPSYERPLHIIVRGKNEPLPVNRTTKVDRKRLTQESEAIVEGLRANGGWDSN
eukprot:gnl/Dysnectes_brevis/1284_a1439_1550.p1 GENE.gnl/Dysnectes_brevis/1284_a1439_1550~~gnl/Dysnectes_brevis/1284_a1439_1550.p1  ORF type:complete len:627 (+),score=218.22 gnl/Dysnectes_brevis/1284_a1439_1550:52-1932(+)